MRLVCLDFETYFDNEYTLKKLSTEAYIRDPRFDVHGVAIKWGKDYEARWYDERQWRYIVEHEDWSDTAIIAHHANFDGLILSHHYNIKPAFWIDTLSMGRLVLGNHLSLGLDSLARHYGLEPKSVPYNLFKGKRWSELSGDVQGALATGACHDVELTWTIAERLLKGFPHDEMQLVDLTVRMFTEPCLRADVELLGRIWTDEAARKKDMLAELGVGEDDLQSAGRFQALLEAEGVEIAWKDGKNGPIPAFAATDEFMKELQDDDNPRVRSLVAARLGVKSTLRQTRCEALGYMAGRGDLCVYLRYCGAHTTRWSGGDKTNFQNLDEVIAPAILPPEGFMIASPDASQIECRILNYLARQEDKIEQFRRGEDIYLDVASAFYGRPITKGDYSERQAGKVLELQCGFGSGAAKIESSLRRFGVPFEPGDGLRGRDAYRSTHPMVVNYWYEASDRLQSMNADLGGDWGPLTVKGKRIYLPNGAPLIYDTLEWHEEEDTGERYWRHRTRHGWQKLYGAKLVENVVQALARLVVAQAMLRIKARGYRITSMRHDDIMVLVPEDGHVHEHLEVLVGEVAAPVSWLPGCPLAAEGELSERYSK